MSSDIEQQNLLLYNMGFHVYLLQCSVFICLDQYVTGLIKSSDIEQLYIMIFHVYLLQCSVFICLSV